MPKKISNTKKNTSENLILIPEESTPFDDVYRTLLEKCRQLIIPVINECFQTQYNMNEEVTLISNEHYYIEENKILKRVTDSCIRIHNHLYHIECQSTKGILMELRMIEYDFHIAVSQSRQNTNQRILRFPESAVLYLRGSDKIPDKLSVKIVFPDKSESCYQIPAIKLQTYSKQEIFDKNLLFFIPYYILKFEEKLKEIDQHEEELLELVADYQEIYEHLRKLEEQQYINSDYLHNLLTLTTKLVDIVADDAPNLKRMVNIMGGKVLELPSEKIRADAKAETLQLMIQNMYHKGQPIEEIAEIAMLTTKEVQDILSKSK